MKKSFLHFHTKNKRNKSLKKKRRGCNYCLFYNILDIRLLSLLLLSKITNLSFRIRILLNLLPFHNILHNYNLLLVWCGDFTVTPFKFVCYFSDSFCFVIKRIAEKGTFNYGINYIFFQIFC